VVAACVGLLPAPALAFDWSLSTTETQTFELNSNQFMRDPSPGGTLGSYTTLTANGVALTPTSRLIVDGNVGYTKYWGPGTEGIAQTESDRVGLHAHYDTWGKNKDDLEYLDGSFRQSSLLTAVLGDLGVLTNVHGDVDQGMIRGGIQRSLSALDTISFSASTALTTYSPASAGIQYTDSSATATWRRRIDPLTTLAVNSQFEYLAYDTIPSENLMLWRNTAGFETAISPVLSYGANLGVIFTRGEFGASPFLPTTAAQLPTFTGGSTVGFIGDAHALYRVTKDTTLNLFASQVVAPVITGQLTKTSTLHAGVTQTLDARSSVTIAGDISQQSFPGATNTLRGINNNVFGTTNDFWSGSISYSYQLARFWNASLTYRYLHRSTTSGGEFLDPLTGLPTSNTVPASANSLLVTVSTTQIVKALGSD
jgi:hypothetical protein